MVRLTERAGLLGIALRESLLVLPDTAVLVKSVAFDLVALGELALGRGNGLKVLNYLIPSTTLSY